MISKLVNIYLLFTYERSIIMGSSDTIKYLITYILKYLHNLRSGVIFLRNALYYTYILMSYNKYAKK